jgi:ferredoxin-NADP reductase
MLLRSCSILVKCVTVPKLIAHADALEKLLEQATELDLAGEYQVQDAAGRLTRVRNLIQLRDRIRFAVEVCSPSKMQRYVSL